MRAPRSQSQAVCLVPPLRMGGSVAFAVDVSRWTRVHCSACHRLGLSAPAFIVLVGCRRDAWWCHSVPAHHHVSVKFCTVVGLLLAIVVGDANGIGVSFTDARDSSMVPLHAGVGAEPLLHTCARGYVFVNVRKTPVRKTPRTRNTPRTRHGNQRSKESRSKESECPAVPGGVKAGQG